MKLIFKLDKEISEEKLQRNIRAHGIFLEYVAIFLVLLMVSETLGKIPFSYLLIICLNFHMEDYHMLFALLSMVQIHF